MALPRRATLAGNWDHLLRVARRAPSRRTPAVPLRAAAILAAEPAIHELMERLTAPLPVGARGVATASVLLTDPTSPVYSRRSPRSLADLLRAAIIQLDPARPLMDAAYAHMVVRPLVAGCLDGCMTTQEAQARILTASREIKADAGTIFELIADPARQPQLGR